MVKSHFRVLLVKRLASMSPGHPFPLPSGFRFPESYLRLAREPKFPNVTPWWFLIEDPDIAMMAYRTINESRRSRKLLLPFAKNDDESGDVACFDGEDTSGEPRVYFAVGTGDMRDVDWISRYFIPTFAAWLDTAAADHLTFQSRSS